MVERGGLQNLDAKVFIRHAGGSRRHRHQRVARHAGRGIDLQQIGLARRLVDHHVGAGPAPAVESAIGPQNKLLDRQRNIIEAAGLADDVKALRASQITDMFTDGTIEPKVVDLQTGEYVDDKAIANASFDERKAAKDESMNTTINAGKFEPVVP